MIDRLMADLKNNEKLGYIEFMKCENTRLTIQELSLFLELQKIYMRHTMMDAYLDLFRSLSRSS